MQMQIWIGIAGTIFALGFLINGWRSSRGDQDGHAANAGRLHIVMALTFLPFLWVAVIASLA